MPALKSTEYYGRIVWLGHVADRAAGLETTPARAMELRFGGPLGEAHSGYTRRSCARVTTQHPLGTEIRNTREVSLVSSEELAHIAEKMGVDALDPVWLGASVVVAGLADFSHLPPGSRLQAPSGATLTVDMQNRPCSLPARVIETARPGQGKAFRSAAKGRRGVTAWVEREGRLNVGDDLRLHVPDQRPWQPD